MALRLEASEGIPDFEPLFGLDIKLRDGDPDVTPEPGFDLDGEPDEDGDERGAPLFDPLLGEPLLFEPIEGRLLELEGDFDGILEPDPDPGDPEPRAAAVLDGFAVYPLLKLLSDGTADPEVYPLLNDFDGDEEGRADPTLDEDLDLDTGWLAAFSEMSYD